jgi:hypothetical protein
MRYLTLFLFFIVFFLSSCSTITSTSSRFHSEKSIKEDKSKEVKKNDSDSLKEDFDITPYRTKIEINDSSLQEDKGESNNLNAWYGYDTTLSNSVLNKPITMIPGYRVLVLTTDNLEEANNMKSEIYFKTDQKPVYISFDPPFYKVKAGDFINSTEATEFGFKLNQMGYTEAKVVRDTVNIFK